MSPGGCLPAQFAFKNSPVRTDFRQVPAPQLYRGSNTGTYHVAVRLRAAGGFYEYYQITQEDDDDESEDYGSENEKELKSSYESSHSLFGIIWTIQKETGWTHSYILWGESWFNIQMKLADAPRVISNKRAREIKDNDELLEFLSGQ